ncbi:MAG: hypothetical protein Q9218_007515 [Villophora microphyllina]
MAQSPRDTKGKMSLDYITNSSAGSERGPTSSTERGPASSTERGPASSTERGPASSTERGSTSICNTCGKPGEDSGQPLLLCGECKAVLYCDEECQNEDWKRGHMEICFDPNWYNLHVQLERKVYELLIDAHRIRVVDDRMLGGNAYLASFAAFQHFLDMAERQQGLLPSWWSRAKRMQCEKVASNHRGWGYLKKDVDNDTITRHYKTAKALVELRMLTEKVYRKPGSRMPTH